MPGFGARLAYAFRCFFSLLFTGTIAQDILAQWAGPPAGRRLRAERPPEPLPPPSRPPRRHRATTRVNAPSSCSPSFSATAAWWTSCRRTSLLTATRRLGMAVRDVHANCRQVLTKYLPRRAGARRRGRDADDPRRHDRPASIRLVGNVGRQTARGTVRHRGWRVGRVSLPPLPDETARLVVAPAEVEVE